MLEKMRRYLKVGIAWLGATAVSVLIASAAVAGIRDRVVETPVAIGLPTSTTADTSAAARGDQVPATTAPATTTTTSTTVTTAPPTTVTTTEAPTSTTSGDAGSPTTTAPPTTTTAPPTTTTTTAPPTTTTSPIEYSTHDLVGGTVVLAFGNGQVNLVSATPRPGFSYDPEHTGPDEVEVKFVSSDHKSKLEAHVDNGELRVETEEEPRDGSDD